MVPLVAPSCRQLRSAASLASDNLAIDAPWWQRITGVSGCKAMDAGSTDEN
jgi:hypothetical protein